LQPDTAGTAPAFRRGPFAERQRSANVAGSDSNWVSLWDASNQLTARFGLLGSEMVERAVHSGEVPVRALKDQIDSIPARIEKLIAAEMKIDVPLCTIHDRFTTFWRNVEIRWPECLAYCEANCIPAWASVPKHQPRGRKPEKMQMVIKEMTIAIDKGEITREELRLMKGKQLEQRFKVGRTTATDARKVVLNDG
jgi:hypothetical protein